MLLTQSGGSGKPRIPASPVIRCSPVIPTWIGSAGTRSSWLSWRRCRDNPTCCGTHSSPARSDVQQKLNPLLVVAAVSSAALAAFHLAVTAIGAPAYRYFGAGEEMARRAEQG